MDDDIKAKEAADDKLIEDAFQHLLSDYLASSHRKKVEIITKAFNFARQAHKGVRRLSGEPYIMHPIAVAQIVCSEIGLGSTSICSALLHDVVEDTDYTVEDIANMFGDKIAQIVDGLTKISGGIFGDKASVQAENFKKLLITMNDDIRVILIKIADRLHNMRTLDSQPANKQYKIAGETLYLYAPLAHRLGLYTIKSELENLSFRFEHPEEYKLIETQLDGIKAKLHETFEDFCKPIRVMLDNMNLKYELRERLKTPYSVWNKMQTKHVLFKEIYDILAVRIIFTPSVPNDRKKEKEECFNIYMALTQIYDAHPDRFRDWIKRPKSNGYQALHVTLMSHSGSWIEVQIRSRRMDEIAEQGIAAHWKYKSGEGEESSEDESELNKWLSTIKEILDDPQPDAMDFLDTIKLNLFANEIFVFTPRGEMKTLPAGATALDFAFSIHTFLGGHCIGAKVNHRLVPLSHKLNSGDQVEILASKSAHVQPSWVNFATTAKAKQKILALLRRDNREHQKQGEQIFIDWMRANGFEPTAENTDRLARYHEQPTREGFYMALGQKIVILGEKDADELNGKNQKSKGGGWRKFVPFVKSQAQIEEEEAAQKAADERLFVVPKDFNRKKPIYITDENIGQFVFCECCHPIPGDDTLGYINSNNCIELHKRVCEVANRLKAGYGNRILDVKWSVHEGKQLFDATIRLDGIDRRGIVNDVTRIIATHENVEIRLIKFTTSEGIFDGEIGLRVFSRHDVTSIVESLGSVDGLQHISDIK